MAKGQKKSHREAKKPKAHKMASAAPVTTMAGAMETASTTKKMK